METFDAIINQLTELLRFPLFTIGQARVTVWTIVYLLVMTFLLYYLTGKLSKLLVYRVMARSKFELGERVAVGSFIRYVVLTVGFVVILQTAGIDLTSITVLLG